jgi:hypothetical protein
VTIIRFGNPAALESGQLLTGEQVTTVNIPERYDEEQCFDVITGLEGVWSTYSAASAPTWIESDNEDLAEQLSEYYACPIGRLGEK